MTTTTALPEWVTSFMSTEPIVPRTADVQQCLDHVSLAHRAALKDARPTQAIFEVMQALQFAGNNPDWQGVCLATLALILAKSDNDEAEVRALLEHVKETANHALATCRVSMAKAVLLARDLKRNAEQVYLAVEDAITDAQLAQMYMTHAGRQAEEDAEQLHWALFGEKR